MELAAFRDLLTPRGQAALADAAGLSPTEPAFLACFETLRKRHPAALAKAALETHILRHKARGKFPQAGRMYFTREALEQASGEAVARHRAVRLAPFGVVADLCSGVGGDTLALAAAGVMVHAVESDPLRAAMAGANAAAVGLADRVRVREADALTIPLPEVRAAFADPSRRDGGNRHLDPEDYTPPLSALLARFPRDFPLAVKVAPGVAWADLADLGAEAEFVSVGGELKECVLWFGPLRGATRRATLLSSLPSPARGEGGGTPPPGEGTKHADNPSLPTPVPEGERGIWTLAAADPPPLPPAGAVGGYVFDPDPAVVRAGLAGLLAAQLGVVPVDPGVALLTGADPVCSPFVTTYRVEWADHYHPRRLNERLRLGRVGRVTPVQIGSRIDPREVVRRLKLGGSEHRFVILTRAGGGQTMIVAERMPSGPVTASWA